MAETKGFAIVGIAVGLTLAFLILVMAFSGSRMDTLCTEAGGIWLSDEETCIDANEIPIKE